MPPFTPKMLSKCQTAWVTAQPPHLQCDLAFTSVKWHDAAYLRDGTKSIHRKHFNGAWHMIGLLKVLATIMLMGGMK